MENLLSPTGRKALYAILGAVGTVVAIFGLAPDASVAAPPASSDAPPASCDVPAAS